MLLLAAIAIGTQSILPLAASADAMYSDIKQVIVEDALTGKTDQEKYWNIERVLGELYEKREYLKNRIVSIHSRYDVGKTYTVQVITALGALFFAAAGYKYHKNHDNAFEGIIFGTAALTGAAGIYFSDLLELKGIKSKIAEINTAIVKLEAMKAELADKLGISAGKLIEISKEDELNAIGEEIAAMNVTLDETLAQLQQQEA